MSTALKRILWVDILRVVAIFLVISTHAGDKVVYALWGKAPIKNHAIVSWWVTGIAYKSFADICVPLLFMVSGYLLLSSNNELVSFFKKRFTKVLIPLLAWSILYLWWDGTFLEKSSLLDVIQTVAVLFLTNSVYFHLWFLYVLVGLYLVTPLLRRFAQAASEKELKYIIGLWLGSVITFELFYQITGYQMALFAQPYVAGYLGYFLAGYYFGKRDYSVKAIWISIVIIILAVTGKTLWAYHLTSDGGKFDTNLFDFLAWDVIILSLASFVALKGAARHIEDRISPNGANAILTVSKATFGIYLIHIIVLKTMDVGLFGIRLYTDSFHPLIAIPVTVAAAFVLSFIIIYPLQKIPYIDKIIP